MIKCEHVTKVFEDGRVAVDDLSLEVSNGRIYCLLGANGAGKSTTIHMFLGLLRPTRGRLSVDGVAVSENEVEVKRRLAYVPESVMLYGSLTGLQNLAFFTRLAGKRDARRIQYDEAASRVCLDPSALGRRVRDYSKGMRQKLALAIALLKGADNLLFDEPTSGLDPKSAHELMLVLRQLRADGRAILVSTHDIFRAKDIADRIGIMREGRLVAELPGTEVRVEELESLYLAHMSQAIRSAADCVAHAAN